MKKYHVLIFFLLKKEEGKKSVFFVVSFFVKIFFIRKKGKLINDESYVSSNECYKSVVKFLPVVFEESVSEADVSNDS
jgi:hypothetical protein